MVDATNAPVPGCALYVVTPVFNDWAALAALVQELDEVAASLPIPITVMAVNDGSPLPLEALLESPPLHLAAVELVSLHCNLGHQRAIATGISEIVSRGSSPLILVMDCDGEDAPADIVRMLQAVDSEPSSIVVASRATRSEGAAFRAFYSVYKLAFRLLTGKKIDFGNFCLLPALAARKLAYMPDCWNHLAATIVKSRIPIVRVPTARAQRYVGKSSMNLVSLVIHGFSAISVFSDAVLTRLFVFVGLMCAAAVGCGLTATIVRLFTDLAIPGWATNVIGLSTLLFAQSLTVIV
ncbi:MAG: glycosyltransferase, partial [Chloroflexi bacterium]|nr:glycosyltransferase [Chloroflexota bacterium]